MSETAALRVEGLGIHYATDAGTIRAANDVTFSLKPQEKLGLVGESGCGKSTTILGIMRLIRPPGQIVAGSVSLEGGVNLVQLPEKDMRRVRYRRISLIPQGAMNSLNPVKRIHDQFEELFDAHRSRDREGRDVRSRVAELLSFVGLDPRTMNLYPHELSGGMKQRVWIAKAISLEPRVILADEPTSALDVVVQRRVMGTLDRVQAEVGASIILIGHDMGLMAQFADTVAVMYAGRIVEIAAVRSIFREPRHPYTEFLIRSIPDVDKKRLFKGIPGSAPSLLNPPPGCPFNARCPIADRAKGCFDIVPDLVELSSGHKVACHVAAGRTP